MERLRALVFQHVDNEGLGYMAPALEKEGVEVNVVNFSRTPNLPNVYHPGLFDFLIVLGGPMGVNDNRDIFPSQTVELATIKKANKFGKPIFGFCLGSQLIAKVLGAKVVPNTYGGVRKKEIGYFGIPFTDEGYKDPLFKGLGAPLTVLEWHGDRFFLPKGAIRLARSLYCEDQAFVYKENGALAYGILFHKEFTPEMVRQQIINDREWIHDVEDPRDDVDEEFLIECADKNASTMEQETRIFIRNMVNLVKEKQLVKVA